MRQMACTPDSNASSCLSRSLDSCVILPNLSPLTDRRKLKPSIGIENIGSDLSSSGFGVGWADGQLQVTTPDGQPPRRSLFDSSLLLSPPRTPHRARTASTITFRSYKQKDAFGDGSKRPHSSPAADEALAMAQHGRLYRSSQTTLAGSNLRPTHSYNGGPPASTSSSTNHHSSSASYSHLRHAGYPGGHLSAASPSHHDSTLTSPSGAAPQVLPVHQSHAAAGQGPLQPPQLRPLVDPAGRRHGAGPLSPSPPLLPDNGLPPCPSSPDAESSDMRHQRRVNTLELNVTQGRTQDRLGVTQMQRSKQAHPMAAFKPSRGQALIVFNEMDNDKNGKLTRSEFEDAAVKLGFNLDQASNLFNRLDRRHRGFLQASDWGNIEAMRVVENFTLMYMQRFMGLPDGTASADQVQRYFQREKLREVKSLPAAINLVRVNAVARGVQSATGSGDAIFDSFRFIDTDGSGGLSMEELRDAFFALGVFLSEAVVGQIMEVFDRNGNGVVNYHEFIRAMFPPSSRGLR